MSENTPQQANAENEEDVVFEQIEDVVEGDGGELEINSADADEQTIIEKLKAALEESEKRALIAVADLENYRKRASKNSQEQIKYAALPMMADLLEAVDNLNRAIDSVPAEESNSGLLEGVKMVSTQILNILKSNKCEPIEAVGQVFDPNLHQAVQMQASDEHPANTVMTELRTGYRLHERVIRPSQVFVSTGAASVTESENE